MSERIAIFFDAENISANHVTSILAKVKSYGDILIQRAYADWSIPNTSSWKNLVAKQPISVYQQFHNGETQVIDKTIIMDAIQIAIEHPEIDTFCIVASDKGYSNLALRLRELGKYVLGIGEEKKTKQDSLLVNACNEFLYIENLKTVDENILLDTNDEEHDKETPDMAKFSLSRFISQAYDSTPKTKDGDIMLSRLSESIKSFKPDFDYNDYGYKSFKAMIESFPDEYEIYDDGKPHPSFMVERKEIRDTDKTLEGRIHKIVRNYGIIRSSDGTDYFFYAGDVLKQFHGIKLKKGMNVRFTVQKAPDENAPSRKDRNGRADKIEILG